MGLQDDAVKNLKVAYEALYSKSREYNLSKDQQDAILDKLVDLFLSETLAKTLKEDENLSEKDGIETCEEIRKILMECKIET